VNDVRRAVQGRPFALIGINGDEKKEAAQKPNDSYHIPWRSFSNGELGPGNPIALAWNVRGWPTVYVIDAKGVIRQKHLRRNKLNVPQENLMAETEAAGKGANR